MKLDETKFRTKNGEEIGIRSPLESDAGIMLVYLRQLFHESSNNLNAPPTQFDKMTVEEEVKLISQTLKSPRNFFLAAFAGDTVIGTLGFRVSEIPVAPHCGELGIGSLRRYHGQGVARALMNRCLEETEKVGVWNIRFTVRTFNAPAIALYEKLGFERVGLLKSVACIEGKYVDEYLYQRVVKPGASTT